MPGKFLDVRGLNCPLPILKTKKALKEVPRGGTLEVVATDPGSMDDMACFCRASGNELVESAGGGGVFRFVIRHMG